MSAYEQTVRDMEQERIDLKQFLEAMRECTDIKELTPTLVNTLIKRIHAYAAGKVHADRRSLCMRSG